MFTLGTDCCIKRPCQEVVLENLWRDSHDWSDLWQRSKSSMSMEQDNNATNIYLQKVCRSFQTCWWHIFMLSLYSFAVKGHKKSQSCLPVMFLWDWWSFDEFILSLSKPNRCLYLFRLNFCVWDCESLKVPYISLLTLKAHTGADLAYRWD